MFENEAILPSSTVETLLPKTGKASLALMAVRFLYLVVWAALDFFLAN